MFVYNQVEHRVKGSPPPESHLGLGKCKIISCIVAKNSQLKRMPAIRIIIIMIHVRRSVKWMRHVANRHHRIRGPCSLYRHVIQLSNFSSDLQK